MRVAVVGHVEWIEFARVEQVPRPGEIVHALETWQEPGGGGAVAAVQLGRLAGDCLFFTALGDDELGRRSADELRALGVRVETAWRTEPQRRAFVHLDSEGERTITVIGPRLGPCGDERLPWDELARCDAVYFTAGDAAAVRSARAARVLVASARAKEVLVEAAVELDVLVASATDEGERIEPGELDPPPRFVALTDGPRGGVLIAADGSRSRWDPVALGNEAGDAYGAGDSFAAGLTYGLASGRSLAEALNVAARCGALCRTGRGPYGRRLTAAEAGA